MGAWSTPSKVGLGIAFCAVFATVALLAGRDSQLQPAHLAPSGGDSGSIAKPAAQLAAPMELPGDRTHDEPSPPASAPAADLAVADLSMQVMPVDETTAEENEQRGDVIRRLSAAPAPDTAQPLIYALRNDVDIRNRILAIDGLRRAALAGNPDRGINDALVDASRSSDEVIASQARQALAEIERARPSR
jgi:hypothetical protein